MHTVVKLDTEEYVAKEEAKEEALEHAKEERDVQYEVKMEEVAERKRLEDEAAKNANQFEAIKALADPRWKKEEHQEEQSQSAPSPGPVPPKPTQSTSDQRCRGCKACVIS